MSKPNTDAELVARAKQIREALPGLTRLPKEMQSRFLNGEVVKLESTIHEVKRIAAEKAEATSQKGAAAKVVRDQMKSVSSTVKGIYGDDSKEYEMVGGKRRSLRKRPVRKPKVAKVG